jgi:chromosome segregation ATPase
VTTKKPVDPRQEPDEVPVAENLKVDRVFAAPRPAAGTRRPSGRTLPPLAGETADAELALRRQLSRLQRQLADAQRELANKDEELAAEVERRVELTTAAEAVQRDRDELVEKSQELAEYRARTEGLDRRLQDAVAAADELRHQLEREHAERQTLAKQLEEQYAAFERTRALWKDESALVAEQHAAELSKVESAKRVAVELVEQQMGAALDRQRDHYEAEIVELKAAHERSLAALRGELEPKVAVARNLSEEIERLNSELAAAKAEHVRDVTERTELHKWETQQQAETLSAQLATAERHHQQEIQKRDEEIAAKTEALAQAERNATLREQLWEQTTSGLRESQKKLQQEIAEVKESLVQSEAAKASFEQQLTEALAQVDKLTAELRELEAKHTDLETVARNSALDRQRIVAHLEEGLAMLGAIPPDSKP